MTGSGSENGASSYAPPERADQDWPSEHVAAFFTEHAVLQRISNGISDAVRVQAANPLVHIAAYLRESLPPAPMLTVVSPTAMPTAAAPASVMQSASHPRSFADTAPSTSTEASVMPPATGGGRLVPSSEEELSRLLRDAGVDLSVWGVAGSKGVRHLLAEIEATECSLRQQAEGSELLRELMRVDVQLHLRGRVLVETHTQMGGRTVQRFKLLSVRMRSSEEWQAAVRRVLRGLLRGAPPAHPPPCGASVVYSPCERSPSVLCPPTHASPGDPRPDGRMRRTAPAWAPLGLLMRPGPHHAQEACPSTATYCRRRPIRSRPLDGPHTPTLASRPSARATL